MENIFENNQNTQGYGARPDNGSPGADSASTSETSGGGTGKPAWMSDPLVKEIPAKKLQFLEQLFAQGQGKSQKELMAYLMPAMKRAKQEHLTFTPQEVNAAIAAIRKYSSEEELKKIDKILASS